MLNSDMREAREGKINIRDMNTDTLSSMIHYIYTGELADGWQKLDIQDVTTAADMYDLPGWIRLFTSDSDTPSGSPSGECKPETQGEQLLMEH